MNANRSDECQVTCGETELPPFHPQCRIFTSRRMAAYSVKLRAAGETKALQQLGAIFHAVIFQLETRWRNN